MAVVRWMLWIAWLTGFLAFVCAFVAICGYWAGVEEWSRWTPAGTTPMALNTAACILALGAGVMILARVAMGEEGRWLRRILKPLTS